MFVTVDPIVTEDFFNERLETSCGAVVSFLGVVRNNHDARPVMKLYYDCYRSMADQEIGAVIDAVKKQYGAKEIKVLHRVGWLEVGEVAVVITVSAAHREEAFSACKAVIDRIKGQVPIWKKEIYADGKSEWVLGDSSHSRAVWSSAGRALVRTAPRGRPGESGNPRTG